MTRSSVTERRVLFLLLEDVHLLDLAGPVQVFYEANGFGGAYTVRFVATDPEVSSAQGLVLGRLEPLPAVREGDLVIVPGIDSARIHSLNDTPAAWLRAARAAGARVVSICSGAFVLARAGLLDHRKCTTHWKVAAELQKQVPSARVLENRLFVEDEGVVTSAGIVSGIDTALWLVEQDHGPQIVARVAREMVVYLRRDGRHPTSSVYLDFRSHLHAGVHRVQDWLTTHPDERPSLAELGRIAGMSPRNLTRLFRQATGVSVKVFSNLLKLEHAGALMQNSELSMEGVANRCGFKDARQLRRLWKQRFGVPPSEWTAEYVAQTGEETS